VDPETLHRGPGTWAYFVAGVIFGVVITRGEVISWFRIQEMFRFQGFHMFGVFATALPTAILSVQFLKRRGAHTLGGAPIQIRPKPLESGIRYAAGGACPGPLFALLGSGVTVMGVAIAAAVAGTWTYGAVRATLPH